jgi:uncharacterized protein DUF4440
VRRLASVLILALAATAASAEDTSRAGPLFDELAAMDRELFNVAFVDCDPEKFKALFTEGAEFYHDRDGVKTGEAVTELGDCPRDRGVKRVLVEGSLEVYPIKDYGAIQIGRHMFVTAGQEDVGIAKFVHLWRLRDGQWRLARVLSFDHRLKTEQDGKPAPAAQL